VAVFVDTSGFYALVDRGDPVHESVRAAVAHVSGRGLVTTDYVLVETMLLIEARCGYDAALRFWAGMRSGAAALLGVLGADVAKAWTIVHEWRDQEFGLVDATSFAVMERLGIHEAISLDDHFRVYRHGARKRSRFRVLPA